MRLRRNVMALLLTTGLLISLLTGCSSEVGFLNPGGEKQQPVEISTDIYIPIVRMRTLNPLISKDEDAYYINKLIYNGLFELDGSLTPEPVLASDWSMNGDGTSMTLNLKNGIVWHDGRPFTSEDVKFSIDSYLSVRNSGVSLYDSYVKNISSVKTKGQYQVVINFSSADGAGPQNLTFPILPAHGYRSTSDLKGQVESFMPVGTGPYQVSQIDLFKGITLTGNMAYFGQNKPTNTLHFNVLPSKTDAVNLFELNKVSITFSKNIDRDTIFDRESTNIVPFPSNEVEFIGFNCQNPALQDKRIRQAIAYGIDAQKIIDSAYYKSGMLNDNIYFPNYLGVNSREVMYTENLEKALQLLKEAGYIERDGDVYLENAEGAELELTLLVNSEDASRVSASKIIEEGLNKLPIHVTVVSRDWNSYNSTLASGGYDMYIGGYKINDSYDLRFLLKSGNNLLGYSNPTLDGLLDKMATGIQNEEKKETFKEVKKILNDEMPYYCLLYKTYGAVASPTLKGDVLPYFHNLYHNSEQWNCEIPVPDKKNEENTNS